MSIQRLSRAGTPGLLLSVCLASPGLGQETQPNWDYFFRSEARFDDNASLTDPSAGDSAFFINTFGIGNRTRTRVDEFSLDLSAHVRAQDTPTQDEDVVFDDPNISLGYDRAVGDDSLSFSLVARKVDLAFVEALDEVGNLNDLDFDDARGEGSRESLAVRFGGVVNAEAPITFEYGLSTDQRRFVDDPEDDLTDLSRYAADAALLFNITRTLRGVLDVGYDYRDEDDEAQTLRQRARITAGANMALDARTGLQFRLGFSEVRTEQQALDTEETETGIVGSLGVVRELQDGSVSLNYSLDLDENGQLDRLLLGRVFDRDDTVFGGEIGFSARELTDDIRPIGTVFITQDLPSATFAASLRQDFGTAGDTTDTVFTRLDLSYEQDVTSTLSFILDLSAARRFADTDDNDDEERRRLNVTASMRNALTQNWDIDVGYRYRYREGDDDNVGTSNAVFVALVRDLQID